MSKKSVYEAGWRSPHFVTGRHAGLKRHVQKCGGYGRPTSYKTGVCLRLRGDGYLMVFWRRSKPKTEEVLGHEHWMARLMTDAGAVMVEDIISENGSYTQLWMVQPPEQSMGWHVTDDEWNHDGTVRTIKAIERLGSSK